VLRNEYDLSNPCSSRTDDFFFSSYLPYRTLSSERRCLAEVSMEMQSHLFLSSYLKKLPSLLSSPRKITFSSDLHFCRMVVTDERLQVRRLLIFFQNFPKDVFRRKFLFPWGGNGDAKVVFFLAGSFSRNREVFESDGLIRRFFFFLIYRC